MTKKYLVTGMAAILGASLSFFACESATDGTAGTADEPGFGFVSGTGASLIVYRLSLIPFHTPDAGSDTRYREGMESKTGGV
jgi:hypothetical protein